MQIIWVLCFLNFFVILVTSLSFENDKATQKGNVIISHTSEEDGSACDFRAGQILLGVHVKFWEWHMNDWQDAPKSEITTVYLKSRHARTASSPFRGICALLGVHGFRGTLEPKESDSKSTDLHSSHNKDHLM